MTDSDHTPDRAAAPTGEGLDPNLPIHYQLNGDVLLQEQAAQAGDQDDTAPAQVVAARRISAVAQGTLALLGDLHNADNAILALAGLIDAAEAAHDALTDVVDGVDDPTFAYSQFPLLVHEQLPAAARPHLGLGRTLRISEVIGQKWLDEVITDAALTLTLATAIARTQTSLYGPISLNSSAVTQLAAARTALATTAAAIGVHGGVAA